MFQIVLLMKLAASIFLFELVTLTLKLFDTPLGRVNSVISLIFWSGISVVFFRLIVIIIFGAYLFNSWFYKLHGVGYD